MRPKLVPADAQRVADLILVPGGWLSLRWSSGGTDLFRGVQAFRNSGRADAETIGDQDGAATIPSGTCFHFCTDVGYRIAGEQIPSSATLELSCPVLLASSKPS